MLLGTVHLHFDLGEASTQPRLPEIRRILCIVFGASALVLLHTEGCDRTHVRVAEKILIDVEHLACLALVALFEDIGVRIPVVDTTGKGRGRGAIRWNEQANDRNKVSLVVTIVRGDVGLDNPESETHVGIGVDSRSKKKGC